MKNLFIALLLSLNLISCTTSKCTHDITRFNLFTMSEQTILPIKSFVKLDSSAKIEADEERLVRFSSASGFFVSEDKIVTAAHFCNIFSIKLHFAKMGVPVKDAYFEITTFAGQQFEVLPIQIDLNNDICLVQVIGPIKTIDKEIIKISDKLPAIGEKVYNIAAPLGIFNPGMVPIFEGHFCGSTSSPIFAGGKVDVYSLPIKGGSSGSPIVNSRGELVGIVIIGVSEFNHLGFSPKFEIIKRFLEI